MKESIRIKNAGPLKDVFIPDIRPLTVLIGASASGKSTLMKIVVLMRYIYKKVNIRSYLKNSEIANAVFYIRFNDMLKDSLKEAIGKNTDIEYAVSIHGHGYKICIKSGRLEKLPEIPNEDLIFNKEVWVSEMRSVIPTWISKGSTARSFNLGFYFDETIGEFNNATDEIKHFELDYLGLDMNVSKAGNNQKKFEIAPKNSSHRPIDLKYASSGTQTTTPLVVLTKYFSNVFSFKKAMQRSIINLLFEKDLTEKYHPGVELSNLPKFVHMHVEEPELSLDPRSQRRLMNTLVRSAFRENADDREVGLFMATHSPYILNHLNVLIRASYSGKGRDSFPYINPEDVAAFHIVDGILSDLMATDEDSGQIVINTMDMSETMENIYNDYAELVEPQV